MYKLKSINNNTKSENRHIIIPHRLSFGKKILLKVLPHDDIPVLSVNISIYGFIDFSYA